MNGEKEISTDKMVNVPAHRMAYIWKERMINVISKWIFSYEPIRESKIEPNILRTMCVAVCVETKKLPYRSGITPSRIQFRISCHYHRKETDRQRERETGEKSCCQNYLLTFCHGCQGIAELQGKPVRNFWVTWNAVGWLCVFTYHSLYTFCLIMLAPLLP
jgi:hypothetical protein